MCAISGIINHHADPEAGKIIRSMSRVQRHRGPDGDGVFVNDDVALAHRRLSIIDREHGAQPMTGEDGQVTVILNGEIYNHPQLREQLEKRGHHFRSRSDTEVLLHLYEELGSECVPMLDGMFAFAIYNARTRRVLLARDRLGKKPLLYFMTGDTLVFSSEFSGLAEHPAMPREFDGKSISNFLSLQYIPSPDTIYANVRKLPPGHQLEIRLSERNVSIRSYWHLDFSLKQEMPFEEAARELRARVEKAVQKRLLADVPLGTFLSGGIDSAVVAGLTAQFRAPGETEAFTIGFDENRYDERAEARATAELINKLSGNTLRHHEQVVSAADFSLVETLAGHFGEPFADASMLPTALLCRYAKEQISVALSGDGADELFCGYDRYRAIRLAGFFDFLPRRLRGPAFKLAAGALPAAGERALPGRVKRFLESVASDPNYRYFDLLDRCPAPIKRQIFGEKLEGALKHDSREVFESIRWEFTAPNRIERLSELDLRTYLVNDILPKVDIASMASALEVRSPFLDREVVEFAARLPLEYKLRGTSGKHILKAAFPDLLPDSIRRRPKRGFGVPIGHYLRGEWSHLAREAVFDGKLISGGYFKPKPLERLWQQNQSGQRDYSYLFWNLVILSLFIDRNLKS